MKNIIKQFGSIALTAILIFSMAACDDGGGDGNGGDNTPSGGAALVAKWYSSQAAADADGDNPTYEFKSDGKLIVASMDAGYTYTATATSITVKNSGVDLGTATYAVSGTKLTLSNVGNSGLYAGDYYKKGSGTNPPSGEWTWTGITQFGGTGNTINCIAYGNNKFVAGGDKGKIEYSTDGITWTAVSNSKFGTTSSDYINGIAYGGNKWVAVGGSDVYVAYSADGETWTEVTNSTFDSTINGIAYGNNRFIAVGLGGKMAYSADGETWTAVADSKFGTSAINGIAYGNNRWIAVGDGNKMAYSTDNGETWTAVAASKFETNEQINCIAYANGRWVAGGRKGNKDPYYLSDGRIVYSTDDGVTWTVGTDRGNEYTGIAFGNNRWVAVSTSPVSYNSTNNGAAWNQRDLPFGSSINGARGIAYGNNKFVAVGTNGRMAYSSN
jgi:hypothetical protein